MSEHPSPSLPRLTDAEAAEFKALGLTPGHWAALAPIPLFLGSILRRPEYADFDCFRTLGNLLPTVVRSESEAGEFWTRWLVSRPPAGALALLGWHLAHHVPREDREQYLAELDTAALRFCPQGLLYPVVPPDISRMAREALETALGHREFARHLTPIRKPLDESLLGLTTSSDVWKQAFLMQVAATLAEPNPTPTTEAALGTAVRQLASVSFAERYQLLESLREWVAKSLSDDDRGQIARAQVERVRTMTEDMLRDLGGVAAAPSLPFAEEMPPTVPVPVPPPVMPAKPLPVAVAPAPPPAAPPSPAPSAKRTIVPEVATDFVTVSFSAALKQAGEVTVPQVREWLANPENARRFLFDSFREECAEVAVVRDPAAVPKSLWIIGDLHADVLALANIIAHADRVAAEEGEPAAFVFLGDFVDRGRHDHETLLLLFRLIMKDPGRVCVIPGNHDVDLQWGEKQNRFGVTISPAEYCDGLNRILTGEDPADPDRIDMAKLLIEFCKQRPKAVILPDGTLLAHAGFPHTDLQKAEADSRKGVAERILLRDVKQLGEPAAVSDFLWARLSESPKKRPNRFGGRGHEFGYRDFAQFCQIMTTVVGVPVRRLIRGHDHVAARWLLPPDYADYPVLTINAMGRLLEGESFTTDGSHPFPVMARHVPGSLLRVVRLPLDPVEVDRAFGHEKPAESPPQSGNTPEEVSLGLALDAFTSGIPVDSPPASPPPKNRPEKPATGDQGGGV